jgi:hypothetical protein
MDTKPIPSNSELSNQHDVNQDHPRDGLRVLARLIARDLIAKNSVHIREGSNKEESDSTS